MTLNNMHACLIRFCPQLCLGASREQLLFSSSLTTSVDYFRCYHDVTVTSLSDGVYMCYYTHTVFNKKTLLQETNHFPEADGIYSEEKHSEESRPPAPAKALWPVQRCDTHQHVHVEHPAVLLRTDAERLQVHAALVVEYPIEGVSDLRAKVITSSTFKFRRSVG